MKKTMMIGMGAALMFGLSACYVPSAADEKPRPNNRAAESTPNVEDTETGGASSETSETPKAQAPTKTQAEELRDCIAKTGTASEKKVAKHITKVTGAAQGEIIAMADVYTDLSGDMFSSDGNTGNLIAAAFSSCFKSDDGGSGLVTIYNESGEMIANGNY